MFHVEICQAPHRLARLNLSEEDLTATVLAPWVRGEDVQLGERTWSPRAAEITILQGPEVPIGGMAVGRGWSTASRSGKDVTEAMLSVAREAVASVSEASAGSAAVAGEGAAVTGNGVAAATSGGGAVSGTPSRAEERLLADSLGLNLLRALSGGEMSLRSAWRLAAESNPQMSPGSSLEIASKAIATLASAKLIIVVAAGGEQKGAEVDEGELKGRLAHIDSWAEGDSPTALSIRRA